MNAIGKAAGNVVFSVVVLAAANLYAALPDVNEIVLQAKPDSGHLQDVCYDGGRFLYWAHTKALYKTDLSGNVVKMVSVDGHHAGLEVKNGRLFVAVCPMQGKTKGKTTPECRLTVGEYDADTLALVKMHTTDINDRAGSLAILADALPGESSDRAFARLAAGDVPARASQYFRHYVFEAYFRRGRGDLFLRDLDEWRETVRVGGSCTFEKGLEFRSDCHAWSAHPIFWLQSGLAGVRPASNAFASVEIRPAPGNLRRISSSLPHPLGAVEAEMEFDESGGVRARVRSPVPGTFVWRGRTASVAPGETTFVEMKGERQ